MKFGQHGVFDLEIYDENGKFVTKLDFLNEGDIDIKENRIRISSQLLNTELLEFMYETEKDDRSDFDKAFNKNNTPTILVKDSFKKCKLIARTEIRSSSTCLDHTLVYEIPNTHIDTGLHLPHSSNRVADYFLVFHINTFDDSGHLFKIHIEYERGER